MGSIGQEARPENRVAAQSDEARAEILSPEHLSIRLNRHRHRHAGNASFAIQAEITYAEKRERAKLFEELRKKIGRRTEVAVCYSSSAPRRR
jgi:hypothetical protein